MSKYGKISLISKIGVFFIVITLNILFFPTLTPYVQQGYNRFTIKMGDTVVGVTDDVGRIYDLYREARKTMAHGSPDIVFADYCPLSYEGEEVIYGEVDSEETIIANMVNVFERGKKGTISHGYVVKVGDVLFRVATADDVASVLSYGISQYNSESDHFVIDLSLDPDRELNVLVATAYKAEKKAENNNDMLIMAGFDSEFLYSKEEVLDSMAEGFDAYDYGIQSMDFSENIEIVETYTDISSIMDVASAQDMLFNLQETQQIYTVKSGDTLSGISISVGLPLDQIVALNSSIANENSTIRIGQELIITVPEPMLEVDWTEVADIEEAYNLPVEYIYNNDWYTNQQVTRVQPSAGYHKAVLEISHTGNTVNSSETLYEEIYTEPVAKVVEVGTIIPPTFIKPLSGGMMSSGFGPRRSPTRGASSSHMGIDWATPTGTTIYASSGGVVAKAGWSGGYGYCVLITHPNGMQTRYAHLSRCLVSAGQSVSQGQAVGLSGSTGISTGPHLHFEVIVGGRQVNPMNYL